MNYKINIIFSLVAAFVFTLLFTPFAFAQTQVSYGQTISDSISAAREQDEFVFSGTSGDAVLLSFAKTSGDLVPYVELLDPQGTCIAYSSSGAINASLANTGDFKITLRDDNGDIGSSDSQLNFQFSANSGDTLYIPLPELSRVSEGFTPYLELYDSSGVRLAYSTNGALTATVPKGESYSLSLSDGTSGNTGDYEFTLQRANNPENIKDLDYNSISEDALEAATGINAYRLTANANDKISICSLVEAVSSGNFNCYLELYDSSGTLLAFGSGSLKYTFASGGTFYLLVGDDNRDGTGKYKIILLNGDASCPAIDWSNPQVSLIKPQAAEIIESGSTYKILWSSSDDAQVASQEIGLSLDSGATYSAWIASGLAGAVQSYDWTIPDDLSTSRARIKVTAYDAQRNKGEDVTRGDITIISTVLPDDAVNIDYEYDTLKRLINSTAAFAASSYTYDALGNRLGLLTVSDTTLPTTPVVTDSGRFTNKRDRLYASWSSSDPESGISEYQYCIGTAKGTSDILDWTSAGTGTSITQTGLSLADSSTYYFGIKARNAENLWSATGYSDGITVDTIPPTGSIRINKGAQYAYTDHVNLSLSTSDAISGMGSGSQVQLSNNGSYSWSLPQTYAARKSWRLVSGTGNRTVYVKFKDAAGNWSRVYSDSITVRPRPNQLPVARITASPTGGRASLRVRFYGNESTDGDGEIASYSWDFGDGKNSIAVNPTHVFVNNSTGKTKYFTVTLTVTDNQGASSSARTKITVLPRYRSRFRWFSGWW